MTFQVFLLCCACFVESVKCSVLWAGKLIPLPQASPASIDCIENMEKPSRDTSRKHFTTMPRAGTDFRAHRKRAKGLWSGPEKGSGKLEKRAVFGLSCDRKGTFRKSLLQKGFLTQNRAQKGKRAIRARLVCLNWEVSWQLEKIAKPFMGKDRIGIIFQQKTKAFRKKPILFSYYSWHSNLMTYFLEWHDSRISRITGHILYLPWVSLKSFRSKRNLSWHSSVKGFTSAPCHAKTHLMYQLVPSPPMGVLSMAVYRGTWPTWNIQIYVTSQWFTSQSVWYDKGKHSRF